MSHAARAGSPLGRRSIALAVLVAALGYFVDIYDLILFSIVRVRSLTDIGVPADRMLETGVLLLNMQMAGMLLGGIAWGVLGDRRGRLSVLFGSIVMYSLANVLNAFVATVPQYAVLRFVAGVGLAGELGAGITLVSEIMPRETRGYATTLVAAVGICGAVAAVLVGDLFDWRVAYIVGGVMGLTLLLLRIGVHESGMFEQVKGEAHARGRFLQLFATRDRATRYIAIILVGVPIWYVVGILITFSPEFGRAMGMSPPPTAGRAVMFTYMGLAVGDLASGWLSQWVRSRKRVLRWFLSLTALLVGVYFLPGARPLGAFYALCFALGFATGYWAVFVTVASEQFGTNLRATATTTVPNFVRGAVVPLTSAFQVLTPMVGITWSGLSVGIVALVLAAAALRLLGETHGRDLNFLEH
jgi:MFS transporter, putative metabolite:H+ symporter